MVGRRSTGRRVPRQPSLFGVSASDPGPADLAGLLAGPGEVRRMGGTAQLRVWVDAAWRVHALLAELARRDLPGSWEPSEPEGFVARTAFTSRLAWLTSEWYPPEAGGRKRPPVRLHLTGHALRLWVVAAGHPVPGGYLLGLGDPEGEPAEPPGQGPTWPVVGRALAVAGVPAVRLSRGVDPPEGGAPDPAAEALVGRPVFRITGRLRVARLVELVGEAPPAAPSGVWPGTGAGDHVEDHPI